MDHRYIQEQNIAERYVLSKLSTVEEARFEGHFIDCQECQDDLKSVEAFSRALKTAAAEGILRNRVQTRWSSRTPRLRQWRQTAMVACAMLLIGALPALWFIAENRRVQQELKQARSSSTDWEIRYNNLEREKLDAARELQVAEQKFIAQRQQFETALERERLTRAAEKTDQPGPATAQVPIFNLEKVRSIGLDPTKPVNQIAVPRSSGWVILLPELEDEPEIRSYRATLQNADQRIVRELRNLQPNSQSRLGLTFAAALFKPGNYVLKLEGLDHKGVRVSETRYPLYVPEQ